MNFIIMVIQLAVFLSGVALFLLLLSYAWPILLLLVVLAIVLGVASGSNEGRDK